jgi:SAM-dependent methyltransferase
MPGQPVDYDSIAGSYDRRFVNDPSDETLAALLGLAWETSPGRILEVGCGTGHWLTGLKNRTKNPVFQFQLHGLDLSIGMLFQARGKGGDLCLVHGGAERLPYECDTFDLIYCVNALHHFTQPCDFINEAARLLKPTGILAVIGTDPRGHKDDWYVYQYFPGTFERDLARFPSWGTVVDWMVDAGFAEISLKPARHIHDPKTGRVILDDPFLEKNAASQLALVSDQEYQAGIGRIREALAAAEARSEDLFFACDIHQSMLSASPQKE